MSAVQDTQPACYHCGLPVPSGIRYTAIVLQQPRDMCCHGCQAVAEAIVENGLEDYYRYRTELPKNVEDLVPDELRDLQLYDHPEVQKSFVSASQDQRKEASLILEGITCAACIWLNERHLRQLPGILQVSINYTSHRARVSWDDSRIKLSDILIEIRKLGYHAHPLQCAAAGSVAAQTAQGGFPPARRCRSFRRPSHDDCRRPLRRPRARAGIRHGAAAALVQSGAQHPCHVLRCLAVLSGGLAQSENR